MNSMKVRVDIASYFVCGLVISSSPLLIANPELPGGQGTVNLSTARSFSAVVPHVSRDHLRQFHVGNSFFNDPWVTAPSSTTARDGLGPLFNARSCSACHLKDGRGSPPEDSASEPLGLLFRLGTFKSSEASQYNEGLAPDLLYGGQLQNRAITDVKIEAGVSVSYQLLEGYFANGVRFQISDPSYLLQSFSLGEPQEQVILSPRVAPQLVGLGLLEAVDENEILAGEDPFDRDHDGISGKANRVIVATGQSRLGRFGWKAGQPTLEQQNAAAFVNDIGITSRIFPQHKCTKFQIDCLTATHGGSPELEVTPVDRLDRVTLYTQLLAVPKRRNFNDTEVLQGEALFIQLGCQSCHTPRWLTAGNAPLAELRHQTIYPYTDLLLHDMGKELADRYWRGDSQDEANIAPMSREWRTPPLWGIGLIPVVNGHFKLLHDGRANGIEEAILWHGGEGVLSANLYRQLDSRQRARVVAFVESL